MRAVTDAQGQVIARHDFLPFGEELSPQTPPIDRLLFTGQARDVETGLDYFHARQLRVDLGRFTTPDPLTDLAWTDATRGAVTTYGYVWGNPLGFVDPTGMEGDDKYQFLMDIGDSFEVNEAGFTWIVGGSPGTVIANGIVGWQGQIVGTYERFDGTADGPGIVISSGTNGLGDAGGEGGGGGEGEVGDAQRRTGECLGQALSNYNQELQKFLGYAGAKMIGRVAIGVAFGAAGSVVKYARGGGLWAMTAAAVVGGAVGGVTDAWADYRTIQRLESQYVQDVRRCATRSLGPGGAE